MKLQPATAFTLQTCLFLFAAALSMSVYHRLLPRFFNGTYQIESQPAVPFSMPLNFPSAGQRVVVELDATISFYRPPLSVSVDDCLDNVSIDGKPAQLSNVPYCDASNTRPLDLWPLLSMGKHHLTFVLKDYGGAGAFNLSFSNTHPAFLLLLLILGTLCAWYGLLWIRAHPAQKAMAPFLVPLMAGAALRVMYVSVTSFAVRTNDWDRHVEYIKYMLQFWRVPPAAAGWEFHQPPLYYFLAAVLMRLEALALPASALLGNLQLFSLLLSIGCLGLAVGMARLLFAKTERMEAALFLSILAVFPGLVFVSSRLTNDVLLTFLAFLFFYLLLRWWKTGNGKEWYVVVLTAAAAVLTKTSGAIFIALAFLSLFLRPKQERKRMLRTAVLSLGLLILLTGWLPVLRYGIEHDRTRSIVLGNQGMSPDTVVPTNVNTFLVFNPLDVLHIPYNNPTGTAERKEFFWEYFYRSAFFGEFNFNDSFKTISFLLLFFGLLSLPAIACGIADDIAHKRPLMLPVLLTAAALLAGSIAYRLFFAYAPDQDFRFVTLLLAPLSYYAVRGASSLPAGWRRFFTWSLWALVFCAALFFLKLYFSQ